MLKESVQAMIELSKPNVDLIVHDFRELLSERQSENDLSRRLTVFPRRIVSGMVAERVRGLNAFGPCIDALPFHLTGSSQVQKEVEFTVFPNGVFSPQSHACFDAHGAIYEHSIIHGSTLLDRCRAISKYDPLINVIGDDVQVMSFGGVPFEDKVGVPICGPGFHNFGHFLYDGLAAVLEVREKAENRTEIVYIGGKLSNWQAEILDRLGILSSYAPLIRPMKFKYLLVNSLLYGHVPYPTVLLRSVFKILLNSVKPYERVTPHKIFLSRGASQKRNLSNRLEIERYFKNRDYKIVDPSSMELGEVISILYNAKIVVGETGAGMANIGFCQTGTKVLEIQPIRFPDGYVRATCGVLGLKWYIFSAECSGPVAGERSDDITFFVSPDQIAHAMYVIEND